MQMNESYVPQGRSRLSDEQIAQLKPDKNDWLYGFKWVGLPLFGAGFWLANFVASKITSAIAGADINAPSVSFSSGPVIIGLVIFAIAMYYFGQLARGYQHARGIRQNHFKSVKHVKWPLFLGAALLIFMAVGR